MHQGWFSVISTLPAHHRSISNQAVGPQYCLSYVRIILNRKDLKTDACWDMANMHPQYLISSSNDGRPVSGSSNMYASHLRAEQTEPGKLHSLEIASSSNSQQLQMSFPHISDKAHPAQPVSQHSSAHDSRIRGLVCVNDSSNKLKPRANFEFEFVQIKL